MNNGIQISTNDAQDTITARLDRHYTARLDRGDESAAEYIRAQVRAYADEHEMLEGEVVGGEVVGDDGIVRLYTADVAAWR